MPGTAGKPQAFHASSGGGQTAFEQLVVGAVSTVSPLTMQSQGPGHVHWTEYAVAPQLADSYISMHAPPATPPPPADKGAGVHALLPPEPPEPALC